MLEAVELVADLESKIGRAVENVEGLGESATVDGELKERALDMKARQDADGTDDVVVGGQVDDASGDDILVSEAEGARHGLAIDEDETFGVAQKGAAGEDEVCEVLEGVARDGERGQGGEEESLKECTGDVMPDVQSGEDGGALRGVGVLGDFSVSVGDFGKDDKSGEDKVARQEITLDDGTDVVERGGVVVRVQRGSEGSVAVALDSDVNGVGIGGDGDFRGEVRGEIILGGSVGDFEHGDFVFVAKIHDFGRVGKD